MRVIALTFLIASFVLFAGCSKSGTGTGGGGGNTGGGTAPFVPNCTGAATSFSSDVNPIFQSVCGQSSCHNSGSVNGPGTLLTYAQINSAKSLIRAAIISGAMPKTGTLSAAQKNSIICWIDAGAANN
jgi:hypothetical protein